MEKYSYIGKILIACEESQTITKAFRELGFEAYSCDLLECSGGHPEWHIQGDAIKEAYSGKYILMVAHPPCTYLSRAGARWMYPTAGNIDRERLAKAVEAKKFFMELLNAPISHKVIENPLPLKVVDLPPYTQKIQPYQFGEKFSKLTLLWIENLPKLEHTKIVEDYVPYLPSNTGGKKKGQKYHYTSVTQQQASKTFEGVAKAIAEQYGGFLLENYG